MFDDAGISIVNFEHAIASWVDVESYLIPWRLTL